MIEPGGGWVKATASNGSGGNNCLEVARTVSGNVAVRNSTRPRVVTYFTKDEWTAFLAGAKAGEFDV